MLVENEVLCPQVAGAACLEPVVNRALPLIAAGCLSIVQAGFAPASLGAEETPGVEAWSPGRVDRAHLPNAWRLHEKIISGGQPEGESGYRQLSELGVRTVISVDGAQPQVALAQKYGLRYVHLPHGYDGVPQKRAQELAKAVRDLPGPIYIHCHHGKHRSPVAAAVACVGAGLMPPCRALRVLRTAGTSEHYRGLYLAAARARRIETGLLDELPVEFSEREDVPPMAEAMVSLEGTYNRLQTLAQAGWRPPGDSPDLDPPHEALLLREHFTELLRMQDTLQQPPAFREMLREGERAASQLEAGLRRRFDHRQPVPAAVGHSLARLTENCKACHRRFRDAPAGD
jgi:protein tyrosine phosphatase (PTP) superfamily phosphohydrolase (DUF442 family)